MRAGVENGSEDGREAGASSVPPIRWYRDSIGQRVAQLIVCEPCGARQHDDCVGDLRRCGCMCGAFKKRGDS